VKQYFITIAIFILVIVVWTYKNSPETSSSGVSSSNTETSTTNDEIEENAFTLEVKQSLNLDYLKSFHLPIIIDFGADWCPPCRQMKPNFEKIYKTYQKKAIIKYVDTDNAPQVAMQYPTQYIPTQVFFNSDGTPYAPQNAKERGLEFHYNSNNEHVLTTHVGALSFEQMEQMLKEMGMNG
jgi:thioredoxin 1